MAALVTLARFVSRPECVVVQSLLRSQDIETLMPDFNVLTADFDPSMMESGWRLMVREQDLAKAQVILHDAQDGQGDAD